MDSRLIDRANTHVKEFMGITQNALKTLQGAPVGREPRSKADTAIMLRSLAELPREARQQRMQEMANLAGHKGSSLDNCSLCTMLKDAAKGK